ncbi:MAG: chorismate-binding protein [bacterium]|nr:chorismate-binding protein [bacterium]
MFSERLLTSAQGPIRKVTESLDYQSFDSFFDTVAQRGVILESAEIAPIYGRMSLILIDPPLSIRGKDESFELRALNERGVKLLGLLKDELFGFAENLTRDAQAIRGQVPRKNDLLDESKRHKQPNISFVIKALLAHFEGDDSSLGLYGAFAYDFIRLFEDIPYKGAEVDVPDFNLFFPDQIMVADHFKEKLERHLYEFFDFEVSPEALLLRREADLASQPKPEGPKTPILRDNEMDPEPFKALIEKGKAEIKRGEIFEIVLSRSQYFDCPKHPLDVYRRFRSVNPSPYQFYMNFGDEALVGASPEMFLRIEGDQVTTRPISGTIHRGADTFEDYENMMTLLNSVKEKSELDMLIDLARNDLSRVCKPGVKVTDYRFVEKYSKVMHTVANVEGRLDRERFEPFDALVASLNAGTLTGAPKIAAMRLIEQFEKNARGYYGGNIGYLAFNGNLDFGIIIRTAHIKGGQAEVRVGATILYDSDPTSEFQETQNKGNAFFAILEEK